MLQFNKKYKICSDELLNFSNTTSTSFLSWEKIQFCCFAAAEQQNYQFASEHDFAIGES